MCRAVTNQYPCTKLRIFEKSNAYARAGSRHTADVRYRSIIVLAVDEAW